MRELTGTLMAAYMSVMATGGGSHEPGEIVVAPPPAPFTIHKKPDACKAIVAGDDQPHPDPQRLPPETIKIQKADGSFVTVEVEVARTPDQHEIGLMYRDEIPEGTGMLFVNLDTKNEIGVWMKDTYADLDIVFLDKDGKIVKIEKDAGACDQDHIMGGGDAAYILELPAGSVDLYGLEEGNTVSLPDDMKPRTPAAPVLSAGTQAAFTI